MSRFLIVGSMAWDRTLFLSGPVYPGARVFASSPSADGHLPAGRLGGGAANAACALTNAGHMAAVYAAVPETPSGDKIIAAARKAGCDLRFIARVPGWGGETLILIDPNGERIVMGYKVGSEIDRQAWRRMKRAITPPTPQALAGFAPQGVFLRSALPGHRGICAYPGASVVAHWPSPGEAPVDAHILVGSADDLGELEDPFSAAALVSSGRLEWAVITRGAKGGSAYGKDGRQIDFKAPPAEQVDTTGAGDCFAAGLLEALVAGSDMASALDHAARWGAVTVSLTGSAVVSETQIYPTFLTPG